MSFVDPKELSSLPIYVLHIGHWLLLGRCLLTKGDKVCINTVPY